jgi:hypothetical protein
MAKDATSTILVLGGVAVGGYFLWNMLSTPAAAAAPTPTPAPAPAPSPTPVNSGGVPPSSGSGPAPAAPPPSKAPAAPTPGTVGAGEPANYNAQGGVSTSTPQNLAGLWLSILAWAQTDPAFTVGSDGQLSASGYEWMTYVNAIWPQAPVGFTGTWPPDLGSMFPGVDLSAQMTQNTFFGGLMSFMHTAVPGLSGMGCACDGGNNSALWWLMGAAAGAALLALFANRGGLG